MTQQDNKLNNEQENDCNIFDIDLKQIKQQALNDDANSYNILLNLPEMMNNEHIQLIQSKFPRFKDLHLFFETAYLTSKLSGSSSDASQKSINPHMLLHIYHNIPIEISSIVYSLYQEEDLLILQKNLPTSI